MGGGGGQAKYKKKYSRKAKLNEKLPPPPPPPHNFSNGPSLSRSLYLPYKPLESTLSRVDL